MTMPGGRGATAPHAGGGTLHAGRGGV